MQNRHQKGQPLPKAPRKCPQCGGYITTKPFWTSAGLQSTWGCAICGLTGESQSFYEAKHDIRRPIGGTE